jgi:hypothetical protein
MSYMPEHYFALPHKPDKFCITHYWGSTPGVKSHRHPYGEGDAVLPLLPRVTASARWRWRYCLLVALVVHSRFALMLSTKK